MLSIVISSTLDYALPVQGTLIDRNNGLAGNSKISPNRGRNAKYTGQMKYGLNIASNMPRV